MLGEITTFLLGMLLAGNATKDVFKFHTDKMTWMEARTVCSRDGGSLASNYNQEDFIDLMTNVTDPVWIGNYYSPWAWLLGCYSYTASRDYIEVKADQMKECLNHCHKTNYFGLQNKKCFCFDTFEGSPLQTLSNCTIECPGNSDERCGGKDAITIYMNDICYEKSAEWQGTVSQTWTGKQCLPWASIEDVEKRLEKYFPDGNAENASNYCRNPYAVNRLWCYTSESDWEICDIPPCIKAAEDGIYPCMSFKKPKYRSFQFTQEDCQNENFAICTDDDSPMFWDHNKGTWKNARHQSRWNVSTTKCKSLAGPQIFRLRNKDEVGHSHWFGFRREVCTESDTVPNKMPTKCFSLSKKERNNDLKVEDCDNKNHFICQYMSVTGELLPPVTTQTAKMTTIRKAHGDAKSDCNTLKLAGATLVGMIVGILIGLFLGFWTKRRKASKSRKSADKCPMDSSKTDDTITARHSGRCNSDINKRPPSQLYQHDVTASENLYYSLSNNAEHEATLTNAIEINRVSVSYQKPSDTDDCDHQSGGNSDVYNTLLIYRNPTENVYSTLNDS